MESFETNEEENLKLLKQLSSFQEMTDLNINNYYKESLLDKLERIAIALEKLQD
jgi:hypothetical protein